MPRKILVADDHEIVRHGIKALVERARREWCICGEAQNGQEAVSAASALHPDVVLLDITMPVKNGLEAAIEIQRLGLASRILIFTMHDSARLSDEVRNAGAHGYVLKSRATRDLIVAIERLLAGGTFFGPDTQPEGGLADEGRGEKPDATRSLERGAKAMGRIDAYFSSECWLTGLW